MLTMNATVDTICNKLQQVAIQEQQFIRPRVRKMRDTSMEPQRLFSSVELIEMQNTLVGRILAGIYKKK